MSWIQLEDMEFYAKHGCYREEQLVGNTFLVLIKIQVNLQNAALSDELKDTINYHTIYELTKEEMNKTSRLLEHVAARIISRIKTEFEQIEKIQVKVSKNNPPFDGKVKCVSVEMEG